MNETSDRWISGDAYEQFMGRWSRRIAKKFIDWLNPPTCWDWLEVGCGTGALTQVICANAHPTSVVACDPSPEFVAYARSSFSHPAVAFLVANAEELPRQEGGFDAVASGLVLNFLPTPAKAIRSMRNRLRPGESEYYDYAKSGKDKFSQCLRIDNSIGLHRGSGQELFLILEWISDW